MGGSLGIDEIPKCRVIVWHITNLPCASAFRVPRQASAGTSGVPVSSFGVSGLAEEAFDGSLDGGTGPGCCRVI
jgi:hypothetical protein